MIDLPFNVVHELFRKSFIRSEELKRLREEEEQKRNAEENKRNKNNPAAYRQQAPSKNSNTASPPILTAGDIDELEEMIEEGL